MREIPVNISAEQPAGTPFLVEKCPFNFGEQLNVVSLDLADDKIFSWPMVYILTNKNSAYVGQTTSLISRITQHGANEEKRDFQNANIIYHDEFNASVVTDYENRLIALMHADGKYKLTNKNQGMSDTNYFSKKKYAEMFELLWEELRDNELAKGTIDELEESDVFKYSPYKGLTTEQNQAIERILAEVDKGLANAEPLVVEGMPGTGKSILAIYLLKALKDDPKYEGLNIKLLQPVASLRKTLRRSLKTVSGLRSSDVIGPSDLAKELFGFSSDKEKSFDILLVDEAHRLKQRKNLGATFKNHDITSAKLGLSKESTQLDWVLSQTKLPIFFYDPLQAIGPRCVNASDLSEKLDLDLVEPIKLETQMRVKGGKRYIDHILAVLFDEKPPPQNFDNYDFVLHEDYSSFDESFKATYSKHNLTRLVAGYAWKYVTKKNKDPNLFDICIDGISRRWNSTYEDWIGLGVDRPEVAQEVGCIHSIQGYDLSYAYVIIGQDIELDPKTGLLRANKKKYFDATGKATASQEELNQYIKNIYYVLLTRGVFGTHIYVVNPELRAYLKQFFLPSQIQ